jgi:hypothetical protein
MKTERARRELGWRPGHGAMATLREMIATERAEASAR